MQISVRFIKVRYHNIILVHIMNFRVWLGLFTISG